MGAAADAIAAHYPSAPARETDVAVALLTLWALDAIEAGRLSENDASTIFTQLWSDVTDHKDGPDLAPEADELLFDGGWLHDEAIGAAPDRGNLRRLAHTILSAA
jgi:hypothetical protein